MPELINARTAAEIVGVSPKTIAAWADKGRLTIYHDSENRRRYDMEEVRKLA